MYNYVVLTPVTSNWIVCHESVWASGCGLFVLIATKYCIFTFRAVSPVVVGSIFAWSISEGLKLGFPLNVHFAFTLLSIGSVLAIATSCVLPEGLNRRQPEDTTRV